MCHQSPLHLVSGHLQVLVGIGSGPAQHLCHHHHCLALQLSLTPPMQDRYSPFHYHLPYPMDNLKTSDLGVPWYSQRFVDTPLSCVPACSAAGPSGHIAHTRLSDSRSSQGVCRTHPAWSPQSSTGTAQPLLYSTAPIDNEDKRRCS